MHFACILHIYCMAMMAYSCGGGRGSRLLFRNWGPFSRGARVPHQQEMWLGHYDMACRAVTAQQERQANWRRIRDCGVMWHLARMEKKYVCPQGRPAPYPTSTPTPYPTPKTQNPTQNQKNTKITTNKNKSQNQNSKIPNTNNKRQIANYKWQKQKRGKFTWKNSQTKNSLPT